MTLQQKVIKTAYGMQLTFGVAYHQITSMSGNKRQIEMQLTTYNDDSKLDVLENKTYVFNPSTDENALRWDKQGYEYLKTTDEFKDAIDV